MKPATYRDLAWDGLADVVREAGEAAATDDDLGAALAELRKRFDAAIDAIPPLAHALDRAVDEGEGETDSVDPINRADQIAAQISGAFQKK
jgi:hypothetical protein